MGLMFFKSQSPISSRDKDIFHNIEAVTPAVVAYQLFRWWSEKHSENAENDCPSVHPWMHQLPD